MVPAPNQDPDAVPEHGYVVVDQMGKDVSPDGVCGMAGNVSEWTGDLEASATFSSVKVAIIRGANFQTKDSSHLLLTYRVSNIVPGKRFFWLGFRCASDNPPPEGK
jgi:formylglycine-generating enzyme required for sulfatase activity